MSLKRSTTSLRLRRTPRRVRRVLGIDPGLARTGYAVVEQRGHGLCAITYGCITTSASGRYADRLLVLERAIARIIRQHRPESAAIEKLFFAQNVTSAFAVGQARGVILLALGRARLYPDEFTPQQMKSAVAGYGTATKQQVQRMVQLLLRLPETPKPDDTADALAVAITALAITRAHPSRP